MKITEITEGWGEYSNKSNHRMNKFKRNEEVDENWGEFKSAAQRGAQAVGGSIGRTFSRGANAIGAKFGSGRAAGAKKIDQATMGVYKNYQRYLGQANLEMDYSSLQNYLKALGIEKPVMKENFAPGADPIKGQKGATTTFTKNQVMQIIRNNLEAGVKTGTLPKEIQKFLST